MKKILVLILLTFSVNSMAEKILYCVSETGVFISSKDYSLEQGFIKPTKIIMKFNDSYTDLELRIGSINRKLYCETPYPDLYLDDGTLMKKNSHAHLLTCLEKGKQSNDLVYFNKESKNFFFSVLSPFGTAELMQDGDNSSILAGACEDFEG